MDPNTVPQPAPSGKGRYRLSSLPRFFGDCFRSASTRPWTEYVLSILTVAVGTIFRVGLDPVLGEHHPFTLYFAAVAISAWYGGLGPGVLAIVLSYFAADWFFITPRFEINLPHNNLDEFLALLLFLFSGFAIAITSSIMRRALKQARQKQRELECEIAERQRTREALERAQAELRRHAHLLEQRVAERTEYLQETIRSLEGVCYHIAHDLRAPLRAMDGFTTLLCREYSAKLEGSGQLYADQILKAAQRMDLLIHGLLEFGRLGHEDFPLERLEIEPMITRVVSRFSAEVSSAHAHIEVADCDAEVLANESLLEIILRNLLSNALKFVRPGVVPRVRIWTEKSGDSVRIWVEDNGIGIPQEYAQKAFGIFERLHPAYQFPGTGMGLAVAAKAAERMKGRLGVQSSMDQGSRFWIELPAASKSRPDEPGVEHETRASYSLAVH